MCVHVCACMYAGAVSCACVCGAEVEISVLLYYSVYLESLRQRLVVNLDLRDSASG